MNINIRTAVIDDCERIRPLQKEIADLHHNGRPDLFKTEARYFTKEAFAERLSDSKHTIYIAETDNGEVPLTMLKQCLRIGQAMKELHVT